MGFQDLLFKLDIPFDSQEAIEIADTVQELVSYHAILTSSELAAERGSYGSYEGSKWSRGLLPIDTVDLLEQERGCQSTCREPQRLDWDLVRNHIKTHGMRNSNTMAIAPTATISNISGCFPCIEPIYKNIYVKANISGEFTIVNSYLIEDLKQQNLWNQEMLDKLKYCDGNLQLIPEVPAELKRKYKEAFEIDAEHCIALTAARAKWIDQSQSHNVFLKGTSGRKLSETYMAAWRAGLKTTYYLRSLAATQVEKSTLDASKFGYTQKREYEAMAASNSAANHAAVEAVASAVASTPLEATAEAAHTVSAAAAAAAPTPATETASAGTKSPLMPGGLTPPTSGASFGPAPSMQTPETGAGEVKLCRIDDPDCEACQ